jgi:D-alanyl-lipoteichoic acid acyltransferase DltB (MBOAT superfamily)
LSSFIRDYIYIPLGGNRRGFGRTQLNVLLGMLISGLWHGANWTFVVWGLLHGLGVVVVNGAQRLGMPVWPRWAAQMMTFVFVSLAWVFFRADSVPQALQMLQGLFFNAKGFWADDIPQAWSLVLIALCVAGLSPWAAQWEHKATVHLARLPLWGGVLVLALLLCLVLFYGPEGVPNFIYYRF